MNSIMLVNLTNSALPSDNTPYQGSSIPDFPNLVAGQYSSLVEMQERLVELNVIATPEAADKFTEYNTHSVYGVYAASSRVDSTTQQHKPELIGYFLLFYVLTDKAGDRSAQALLYRTPKPSMTHTDSTTLAANTYMKYVPIKTPLGRMLNDAISAVPASTKYAAKTKEVITILNSIMFAGDAQTVVCEQVEFQPSVKY